MISKFPFILCNILILFILGAHISESQAEYFSSIDKIQKLDSAEKDLLKWYKKFIIAQAEEFSVYRKFIAKVKDDHALALEDPESFLSNPINAFKLIKRTVDDWPQIAEYAKNNTQLHALKTNLMSLEKEMQLPDGNDLRGAAMGLARIQMIYNLTSYDLAKGIINGIDYGTELSFEDCFEIGATLFEENQYNLALNWFEKVLKNLVMEENIEMKRSEKDEDSLKNFEKIYDEDDDIELTKYDYDYDHSVDDELLNNRDLVYDDQYEIDKSSLLYQKSSSIEKVAKMLKDSIEYLALAKYELGHREEAISYIKEAMTLNPEESFKYLEIYINMKKPMNLTGLESLNSLKQNYGFSNYLRLCQGKQLPKKELHKLYCSLDTFNHPLFILAPLRREQLYTDPEIVIYHGLLSDTKILKILEETSAHMNRSLVGTGSSLRVSDVRISQQTRLAYNKSSTVQSIYRIVSAISGYNMSNAEAMQVANYGIGGQYDPHYDFFFNPPKGPLIGDRLATFLLYISDVEQGGNTVFPFLNIYSKPTKGSMLMWQNLHKSLQPDYRTLHAGCPVIVGTKRICNIWLRSGYQEFKKPCDVVEDSYKSADQLKLLF